MMFPRDMIERLNRDFETPEDVELALSVLADFMEQNRELSTDRILRCIVFVASGDFDTLERAIELAKTDYRDLIVWAEYDGHENRVRDLTKPFQ